MLPSLKKTLPPVKPGNKYILSGVATFKKLCPAGIKIMEESCAFVTAETKKNKVIIKLRI
jgi:hypothetical protein